MNQLSQGKREIQIFKKFADICPCRIYINSIKKKDPPEPDTKQGDGSLFDNSRLPLAKQIFIRMMFMLGKQ